MVVYIVIGRSKRLPGDYGKMANVRYGKGECRSLVVNEVQSRQR